MGFRELKVRISSLLCSANRHSCTWGAFTEEFAQALTEEEQMREYRAQLDADRAKKLSKGTNHADLRGAVGEAKSKVMAV